MSVYRHAATQYFHYDFQWKGRRFYGSTGETEERKAKVFERTEKERVRSLANTGALAGASLTFDAAALRYWTERGQYSKERDLTETIARMVQWIGEKTPISDINDNLLATLVARRRGDFRMDNPKLGLVSASTINRTVTELLRRILMRARDTWKIPLPNAPDWKSHIIREAAERTRELSFDEEALIETVERDDYRPARLFAQATGLRRREIVTLTWAQVDWSNSVIRVIGKGDKPHVLPITPELVTILWPLREHHPQQVFTFIAQKTWTERKSGKKFEKGKRYPITEQGWSSTFRRINKKAGVVDFRMHDLRHTALTRTLRSSRNIRAVQKIAGHSDIKTTMRYAHVLMEDMAEAMASRPIDESIRRAENDRRNESRRNPEAGGSADRNILNSKE